MEAIAPMGAAFLNNRNINQPPQIRLMKSGTFLVSISLIPERPRSGKAIPVSGRQIYYCCPFSREVSPTFLRHALTFTDVCTYIRDDNLQS